MPSRRRSRNKNIGNNLAEVTRRLRTLERKPVRTKLSNRVVKTAFIAPNAVTPDEINFGTTLITPETNINNAYVENPKDGLLVVSSTSGESKVFSEEDNTYYPVKDAAATARANDAFQEATDVRTIANGKNTIYYSPSQPSGGTYEVDDTWFDSDDGYKMYTWNGSTWSGFQLGNNAIASISATKITAGSLNADVIVSSNISAGQISAGSLNAGVIVSSSISANQISGGTITGITFQTGGSGGVGTAGRRIRITDNDDIIFHADNDVRVGTLTSTGGTYTKPSEEGDPGYSTTGGILLYGGPAAVDSGAEIYPSLIATADRIKIASSNITRFEASGTNLGMYGPTADINPDITTIFTGYNQTGINYWHLKLKGRLVLESHAEGPYSPGSTAMPSVNGVIPGQVVFRHA